MMGGNSGPRPSHNNTVMAATTTMDGSTRARTMGHTMAVKKPMAGSLFSLRRDWPDVDKTREQDRKTYVAVSHYVETLGNNKYIHVKNENQKTKGSIKNQSRRCHVSRYDLITNEYRKPRLLPTYLPADDA